MSSPETSLIPSLLSFSYLGPASNIRLIQRRCCAFHSRHVLSSGHGAWERQQAENDLKGLAGLGFHPAVQRSHIQGMVSSGAGFLAIDSLLEHTWTWPNAITSLASRTMCS